MIANIDNSTNVAFSKSQLIDDRKSVTFSKKNQLIDLTVSSIIPKYGLQELNESKKEVIIPRVAIEFLAKWY